MSTFKQNRHLLNVRLSDPTPYAEIQVFDGHNKLVGKAVYGEFQQYLRPGLYRIQVRLNNIVSPEQPIIALDKDYTTILNTPGQYSSVPFSGFSSTYDYYLSSAITWSKNFTVNQTEYSKEPVSSLFVFFRFANKEKALESGWAFELGSHFSIWSKPDSGFERQYEFTGENVKKELECGCLAFHVPQNAGTYFLAYLMPSGNYLLWPLYLFNGWQTQLFLTFDMNGPLFESLRMQYAKIEEGFEPDSPDNKHLDNAVLWLQNGIYALPHILIHELDKKLWPNPMLYLVAAHMLMMQLVPQVKYVKRFIRHVEKLIGNKNLPGLKSLKYLIAHRSNKNTTNLSIDEPPLLQPLLDVIIRLSATETGLVRSNGLTDLLSTQLSVHSPWTSVEISAESLNGHDDAWTSTKLVAGWLRQIIISLKRHEQNNRYQKRQGAQAKSVIASPEAQSKPIVPSPRASVSLSQIAESLQLPPTTIKRLIEVAETVLATNPSSMHELSSWFEDSTSGKQSGEALKNIVDKLRKITD